MVSHTVDCTIQLPRLQDLLHGHDDFQNHDRVSLVLLFKTFRPDISANNATNLGNLSSLSNDC